MSSLRDRLQDKGCIGKYHKNYQECSLECSLKMWYLKTKHMFCFCMESPRDPFIRFLTNIKHQKILILQSLNILKSQKSAGTLRIGKLSIGTLRIRTLGIRTLRIRTLKIRILRIRTLGIGTLRIGMLKIGKLRYRKA